MWYPGKKKAAVIGKTAGRSGEFFQSLGIPQGASIDFRTKDYLGLVGASDYSNPWATACVRVRAQDVSSVPLRFYQSARNPEEGPKELPDEHKLTQLFWGPNPHFTRSLLFQLMNINLDLAGECFIVMDKRIASTGRPQELWVLPPDRFTVLDHPTEFIHGYEYRVSSTKTITFAPTDVIFIRYPNPRDHYRGLPPLAGMRQGLISDYNAVVFNQNFFKYGAKASGVIIQAQESGLPGETETKRLRAEIDAAYTGVGNAHRPVLLDPGMDWKEAGVSQKDMEFVLLRKLSREEVLAAFKVPPFKVGVMEYANYANAREQSKSYWMDGVIPTLKIYEEAFNTYLCPFYGENLFCKFDLSDVEALRENEKEKSEIAKNNIASDVWTVNEARKRLWDMPPAEWGDERPSAGKQPSFGDIPPEGEGKRLGQSVITKSLPTDPDEIFNYWEGRYEEQRQSGEFTDKHRFYEQQLDFETKSEKKEKDFVKFMHRFFGGQHPRVWKRLKAAVESGKIKTGYWGAVKALTGLKKAEAQGLTTKQIFECAELHITTKGASKPFRDLLDGEAELLGKNAGPIFADIVSNAGRESVARWGLGIDFDAGTPGITDYLKSKRMKFGLDITSTTATDIETAIAKLRVELGEGVSLGESMPKLADRVGGVFEKANRTRALRIARTEVNDASNKAAKESYKQADVWGDGWVNANDERVRETHVTAGSTYAEGKPIDELFVVGGYEMEAPGDSSHGAGPEETVNCRCGTHPIPNKPGT